MATERLEQSSMNMYEAGHAFYAKKIEEADVAFEAAQTPFELLQATEERELMELKDMQLKRREEVLTKEAEIANDIPQP